MNFQWFSKICIDFHWNSIVDCPFCGAWTGTRLKLVQHRRVGTLACRLQAASLPLLCAADFAAALEADRQVRRKSRLLGVGELACAAGR